MEKQDWIWWAEFRKSTSNKLSNTEYNKISELHAVYFSHKKILPCKCNPKGIQRYINDLNNLFESEPKPRVR